MGIQIGLLVLVLAAQLYISIDAAARGDDRLPQLQGWGNKYSLPPGNRMPLMRPGNSAIVSRADYISRDTARISRLAGGSGRFPSVGRDEGWNHSFTTIIRVGSPYRTKRVIFDTGSQVTWLSCWCDLACQRNWTTRYNTYTPTISGSAQIIRCGSPQCVNAGAECQGDDCSFRITYGDLSAIDGVLLTDDIALSTNITKHRFLFGCSLRPQRQGDADGLLGVGRGEMSLPQQLGVTSFSYCVPPVSENATRTGFISFDTDKNYEQLSSYEFTRMEQSKEYPHWYTVNLAIINIAGVNLDVTGTLTMVDSGATLTYLPTWLADRVDDIYYSVYRRRGRRMDSYTGYSGCYNFTGYAGKIPAVTPASFHFRDGARFQIREDDMVYFPDGHNKRIACPVFTEHTNHEDFIVIGYTQQQTVEMVYEIYSNRLGFGPKGAC